MVTKPAFESRNIGFETVRPAPEHLKAVAIPHHGVKWRQQTHGILQFAARRILSRGPIPVHAIDTRMCEPLFRPLKCLLQRALPLGNSKAQPTDQVCQATTWQWRIDLNSRVNERVDARATLSCIGVCLPVFVTGIDANSTLAPYYPHHAAIMHGRQ